MLELIPLKPNSLLTSRKSKLNALKLMLNILNESLEACEDFLGKKYKAFDAQVGETACQIRAYKICLLVQNEQFITEIQNFILQIQEYKKNIVTQIKVFENNLSKYSNYFRELDYKESKDCFFRKLQPDLLINDNGLFVILSHFLKKYCLFDDDNVPNAIDYNLIKQAFDIGSTPARKLANHYQFLLSKLSCDFILQQVAYIHEVDKNNKFLFLQLLLKIGDRKRYMLPYYYVTKMLLSSIDTANVPIILSLYDRRQNHSEPRILFFQKDSVTNEYVLMSTLSHIDKYAPAIIFRGDVLENQKLSFNDFKNNILQIDVKKIILYNAASHPQYAGEILNNYAIEPYKDIIPKNSELEKIITSNSEELNQARIEAEIMGCSKNNSSFFYIKHIFCSSFYEEYNTWFYGEPLCLNQKHQNVPSKIPLYF